MSRLAPWGVLACLLCFAVDTASAQATGEGAAASTAQTPIETPDAMTALPDDSAWTDRFKGISWPTVSMPEMKMPQVKMPELKAPEFTMPDFKMPSMPWQSESESESASPPTAAKEKASQPNPVTQAVGQVSTASKRAGEGVQSAWNSAISKLRPEPQSKSRVARRDTPGFWSRLFGAEEPSRGSETVTEFLAQERPGISR